MGKKHKNKREEQLLLTEQRNQVLQDALSFSNKRFKKFHEVIMQLYNGDDLSRFFVTDKKMEKINGCFNILPKSDQPLFKDVLIYLTKCSDLISDEVYIAAVYNIVQFRAYWRNDIFQWRTASRQEEPQLKELINYLFCQYKIPEFLYKAFYEAKNTQFIYWFIHLTRGGRVKEMQNIPIPFTQRMGHYFLQAPANMSVNEALRWSQVRGLGGNEKLAE